MPCVVLCQVAQPGTLVRMNDHSGTEHGNDLDETAPEGAQNVVSIGKKHRPRAVREVETAPVAINIYGAVPATATAWACHKQGLHGAFEVLSWGEPGETAELREWPLSQLSEDEIRRRWGAGTFQCQWLKATETGGRRNLQRGRIFTLRAPEAVAPPPAAVASSPLGESFDLTMRVMAMIEKQSDQKVNNVMQMARELGGGGRGGLGGAELQLILQNQSAATEKQIQTAVAAAVAPLQAQLEREDEEGGSTVGAVAAAAAPLIRGKGAWATVANLAMANPDLVKVALPLVADTAMKVLALFTPKASPVAAPAPVVAPAPSPAPRPRAVAEQAAGPVVETGSVSSWRSDDPPAQTGPALDLDDAEEPAPLGGASDGS